MYSETLHSKIGAISQSFNVIARCSDFFRWSSSETSEHAVGRMWQSWHGRSRSDHSDMPIDPEPATSFMIRCFKKRRRFRRPRSHFKSTRHAKTLQHQSEKETLLVLMLESLFAVTRCLTCRSGEAWRVRVRGRNPSRDNPSSSHADNWEENAVRSGEGR